MMLCRFALVVCLSFAWAASTFAGTLREDITALAAHHYLSTPDYWIANAKPEGKCDGGRVAVLLVEVARVFAPVKTKEEALDVLVQRRVISAPEYWEKQAVANGSCQGKNVAAVLARCATHLPVEPPPSAKAAPLAATAPDQMKADYDVVIAGAGMGGIGAAVQAARMGRSVLLLEETDWIGGQAMAAAVTSMDEGGTLVRERGLYRELCGLIASYYQPLGINSNTAYWYGHVCVEPHVGQRLLRMMLGDARGQGVLDLVQQSRVTQVHKTGKQITGVEVTSGKLVKQVTCAVLIDATEWGDVIPLTGARYRAGNCTSDHLDRTRAVQDNTWTAVVKQYPLGVPAELEFKQPPPGYTDKMEAGFKRILVPGDKPDLKAKPWNWGTFIGYRGMPDSSRSGDSPAITRTHLNYGNDYHSSVAELEDPAQRQVTDRAMRLKTLHLLYFIQQVLGKNDWAVANDEGFDTPVNRAAIDAWIVAQPELEPYRAMLYHFSIISYTRESRRIIGLHTLTAPEIERKSAKPIQFVHTVALGDYAVDLHGSMKPQFLESDLDDVTNLPHKFGEHGTGPFAIPFESFIPEQIDGFLPAEKNLSQSRMANGATRLQPHTLLMGQAVGVIAALAVEHKVQPRAVDPVAVQRVLLQAGATLCIDPLPDTPWGTKLWREEQLEVLKSGAPASSN